MTLARTEAPADDQAVATLLQACARDGAAVVAMGGGTLQSLGNAPARCDVVLSLAALRGFALYDPRDMTAGIHAGTTLAEIDRVLRAEGAHLPLDAPCPQRATIGGTIAAGWAGPRRMTYGRSRDAIIGTTVARTDGTLAHAGGMVVKNVSGYDMSKLYAGSLGTLAVLVRANLRVLPMPSAHRLAIAAVPADVRDRAIARVGELDVEPTSTLLLDGFAHVGTLVDVPARLALYFEGSDALVERATRELRSVLGKAGVAETQLWDARDAEQGFAAIIDAYIETDEASLTYRSSGLPSTAAQRASDARTIAAEYGLTGETIADLRTGDVVMRARAVDAATFGAVIGAYDGAIRGAIERSVVLAGTPALRARVDAWGNVPATIETMRALKARFDPQNILAPGRYVGGL